MNKSENNFSGAGRVGVEIGSRDWEGAHINIDDFGIDGLVDESLMIILDDIFPGKRFTRENINDFFAKANITNGEMQKILNAYAYGSASVGLTEAEIDALKSRVMSVEL